MSREGETYIDATKNPLSTLHQEVTKGKKSESAENDTRERSDSDKKPGKWMWMYGFGYMGRYTTEMKFFTMCIGLMWA